MSAIAFDLEIAVIPESGASISPSDRLGISVAAGITDVGHVVIWNGQDESGPTPAMNATEVRSMLADLSAYDKIVTWNGAQFDFWVLGVEADDMESARNLARGDKHIDLMMLFCATRRHRLALKQAAAACGSHKGGGGIESGIDAPALWAQGKYTSAIEYVTQDAQATMDVYQYMLSHRGFEWVSKKGRLMRYTTRFLPDCWSVKSLLEADWPPPDGWITDPVVKDGFTRW